MCKECRSNPCLKRCPNASEQLAVVNCVVCSEGILPGEKFGRVNEKSICLECLSSVSGNEMFELSGGEFVVATEDDFSDRSSFYGE